MFTQSFALVFIIIIVIYYIIVALTCFPIITQRLLKSSQW
jgi:hypothetical protein